MDLVADIKQRLSIDDLVSQYVSLRKSGRNFKALCPFHNEKTPSFYISLEKQIAYCFGCQKGGDIFQFYQEAEGVDFPGALRALAEKVCLDYSKYHSSGQYEKVSKDEKQRLADVHDFAVAFFRKNLWESEDGSKVLEYLHTRGMTDDTIRSWNLGFSSDRSSELYQAALEAHIDKTILIQSGLVIAKDLSADQVHDRFRMRLMFPIQDGQGRVIAFGGRALKKGVEPKYLNSPETAAYHKSETLFALAQAKSAIRHSKRVILVEGYMDALACHQAGIQDVVATSGTALTAEHAKILKRFTDTFFLCFDNDKAGWEATKRAYLVLQAIEASVRVVRIPSGKDPADALLESSDEFVQAVAEARPFFDVYLDRATTESELSPERMAAILTESLEYIQAISNRIIKDVTVRALAARLDVREIVVYDELKRLAHLQKRVYVSLKSNAGQDSSRPTAQRIRPEELLLVCALKAPDKVPLIFERVHEDDFPDTLRPAFVRMRDLVLDGRELTFSAIIEGFPETLTAKLQYFILYGDALYDELPLEIFEKDVKTALDKVIQNRKNVQLEALKTLIKHYQRDGKKFELNDALEQLREQLK